MAAAERVRSAACRLARRLTWRGLLLVALLVWAAQQALLLFPGETLRDRLLYRVAVIREPSGVIITKKASQLPDSAFSEEQKATLRTVFQWATTPTTRCVRQSTFGGQPYLSSQIETHILEGDRPVCFDAGFSIADPTRPCVVYSFGIKDDWSFDDAMARFGCEVHAFDPSIGAAPERRPSGVRFHPVGIGRNDHVNVYGWRIRTLDTVVRELGHAQRPRLSYLKVDGEGAEFDMLSQQLLDARGERALDKFDQIGMEVHFRKAPETEMEFYSRVANLTVRLRQRGWEVAESVPNKIYNKWFHFPGLDKPASHMFDMLLLRPQRV
ncbi:uncharacterized protein LOC119098036 [Pollicipes pollicipes]|uniref:uncharacterized protein LOC119098036 n=1 Tax=Pollicipes pollicipes TaxID=41117 RepID=UPI0018850F77|nr:uncharacterized protein LOC119098036 [Pollicipes pollicipes]